MYRIFTFVTYSVQMLYRRRGIFDLQFTIADLQLRKKKATPISFRAGAVSRDAASGSDREKVFSS